MRLEPSHRSSPLLTVRQLPTSQSIALRKTRAPRRVFSPEIRSQAALPHEHRSRHLTAQNFRIILRSSFIVKKCPTFPI